MPKPRADYECKTCQRQIPDLPLDAQRCPFCGHKRGFRRLYNKVQTSTKGHRQARFIDGQMRPAMDKHTAVRDSAKRFEQASSEAQAKAFELAAPKEREAMAAHGLGIAGRAVPAAAALQSIDPAARMASRNYTYPALQRRVVPQWQR